MFGKTKPERTKFLMRQLRGKLKAKCPGTYRHLIPQVLDEEGIFHLPTRAAYAHQMHAQIAEETKAGKV